mgnify:CR=1 FL=1
MNFKELNFKGSYLVKFESHEDIRGSFFRNYCKIDISSMRYIYERYSNYISIPPWHNYDEINKTDVKRAFNIFLKGDWTYFRSTLVTLSTKDIQIVHGPCVRLSDIAKKRVKRRTIQLVRRPI